MAAELARSGVRVESFDLAPLAGDFARFVRLPAYASDYKTYGGLLEHCLLEKALEHHVSFGLIQPAGGSVGIDIGSCRSVAPSLLRERYGVRCYEQDLAYPPGVQGDRIGGSADAIPLAEHSIDFMTLHCAFEHFKGRADGGFVAECARLLKPGGVAVILPLYLNAHYCNITGETDASRRESIGFDPAARHYCLIPEWLNRFGRYYSAAALLGRVIQPAEAAGLAYRLYRVENWEAIHPLLWLRWILVLRQP